jgi:hypothetical protein
MPIIESLKGFRVALLGSFDSGGFVELVTLSLSFVWLPVGQVAFSGRNPSDAANYLYVVWLAGCRCSTKVISIFKIPEHFYQTLDRIVRCVRLRNPFAGCELSALPALAGFNPIPNLGSQSSKIGTFQPWLPRLPLPPQPVIEALFWGRTG